MPSRAEDAGGKKGKSGDIAQLLGVEAQTEEATTGGVLDLRAGGVMERDTALRQTQPRKYGICTLGLAR